MLLKNKNAVIFGGGGAVGKAVTKVFADEDAKMFLTGRTAEKIKQTVEEIVQKVDYAELAKVDALNQEEVEQHIKGIIELH